MPFIVGANLPWIGYGTDFGASAWHPEGGLSARPAALERLERTLAFLKNDGISIVRVFVLCDGRSGIRYDHAGLPVGLDHACLADMDALMATARKHLLRVMPTLLDFHLCSPLQFVNGVQLGGRAGLILEPEGRAALIDHVLGPIFERYADEDAVAAWDVINEPEWCLEGLHPDWETVPDHAMQTFLHEAVGCARASARQPITIGSAGAWKLDLVQPLGLDFYQVHWYERFGWRALEQPVAELGLDRPVILGEFSGRAAERRVGEVLDAAARAGYQGALVWSVLSEDEQSGYSPEIAAWIRAHAARLGNG
jgi:hypothetical protein